MIVRHRTGPDTALLGCERYDQIRFFNYCIDQQPDLIVQRGEAPSKVVVVIIRQIIGLEAKRERGEGTGQACHRQVSHFGMTVTDFADVS